MAGIHRSDELERGISGNRIADRGSHATTGSDDSDTNAI
jgi:hypothetical protein